jgi:hypothetical protein
VISLLGIAWHKATALPIVKPVAMTPLVAA